MANSNFKVRTGLSIGDSVSISDAGVAAGLTSMTGLTTVDTTNVEATNIKAKDGTAAITIADSTGKVTIAGDLQINGTTTTVNSTTLDIDDINITIAKGAANAAAANGGGITLEGPATAATITYASADDSWNLNKKTSAPELQVDNINVNGNTISNTDTDGSLTISANGTGDIQLNNNNGGNVVASRNFVRGSIRNTDTDSRGNIWELLAAATPTLPTTGLSIDNSLDSTKTAGVLLRNYGSGSTNRARLVFERSRGTAAIPSQVVSGDFLGEVNVTGYTGTGWINDQVAAAPALYAFNATETWTGINNCGASLNISLQPTATTLVQGSQVSVINVSPQQGLFRADTMAMMQGKTTGFIATGCSISGTTLTIGTITSGAVAVGQIITNGGGTISQAAYIVSGSGSTWTLSFAPGNISNQTVTGRVGFISAVSGYTAILNNLRVNGSINNVAGGTQIALSADRSTLELTGDTIYLKNSASTTYATLDSTSATFAQPVGFPVKTAAQWNAITGSVGQQVCVSDSGGGGNPNGMMAFWDTTNNRWSYIHDNSAV